MEALVGDKGAEPA
ncbi:hypothetical protein HaLaN_04570, partial [Haematococcus lacustris]